MDLNCPEYELSRYELPGYELLCMSCRRSGVPEGTVLGSLLLEYSNDLLYADDVQIYYFSKRNDMDSSLIKVNNDIEYKHKQYSVKNKFILDERKRNTLS